MDAATISGASSASSTTENSSNDALRGLKLDDFLKLLISELQNQDPLNPLENNEILAQIGQIREIGATDGLTNTLNSVLLGQNVNNATNLIGKLINGLADDGSEVNGVVDKVTVANGEPTLHVGDKTVKLKNVREIEGQAAA